MRNALPIAALILLPLAGLYTARQTVFDAFDHSHSLHAAGKADVHTAAAQFLDALGRKGSKQKKAKGAAGSSAEEDWHAPQPPAFSSDEENEEHFEEEEAFALPVSHEVHAFYYPWYGTPDVDGKWLHWNHKRIAHWQKERASKFSTDAHIPPDDVGADFYPQAGPYSSRDPHVLSHQMKQLRMAGVGTIVASWFPPSKGDENGAPLDSVWPALMAAADDAGITVAPHFEPYEGRTAESVAEDVRTFLSVYQSSPGLYRWPLDHRPMIYIYDSYRIKPEEWTKVLQPGGAKSIRKTANDAFVVGLILDTAGATHVAEGGFDGAYTYFASRTASALAQPEHWAAAAKTLKRLGVAFIPSVGPGYSDVSVRPWNSAATQEREDGKYYDGEWRHAIAADPEVVSVTSWNEWHEGTQIEPAVPKEAGGRKYMDYGKMKPDGYLRKTRVWAMRFKDERSRKQHAAREALLP